MKKKLLSAMLAVGLLAGATAVQADTLHFTSKNTGFWFDEAADVWTGSFLVDGAFNAEKVILWTDSWETSFDPFLVVWDAAGNKLAYNDNKAVGNGNSYIDFGVGDLAGGLYYFTIGNWPNAPAGSNISNGFTGWSGGVQPNRGDGSWSVYIQGVSAVPEPETWAMLLAGLGIVGAVARRRKQY